jgi:hypothetical protein
MVEAKAIWNTRSVRRTSLNSRAACNSLRCSSRSTSIHYDRHFKRDKCKILNTNPISWFNVQSDPRALKCSYRVTLVPKFSPTLLRKFPSLQSFFCVSNRLYISIPPIVACRDIDSSLTCYCFNVRKYFFCDCREQLHKNSTNCQRHDNFLRQNSMSLWRHREERDAHSSEFLKLFVCESHCNSLVICMMSDVNIPIFVVITVCSVPNSRLFFHGIRAPGGPGPPHYRGFTTTCRHTSLGRDPLYEGEGLKPAISASERPLGSATSRLIQKDII